MHVAAYRDPGLLLVEGPGGLHALARLADVELRVHGRTRVDVVQRLVVVLDLQRLSHLQGDHVRRVHAALLVQLHRLGGRGIGAAQPALDVDEDVLEAAVLHRHRLALQPLLVLFLAVGIGGDLDLLRRGRRAREADLARHRRRALAGAATARRGRRGLRAGGSGRGRFLLLAAAAGDDGKGRGQGENGKGVSHGHHLSPREGSADVRGPCA